MLRVASVKAPAFMGLNTQESEVTLADGYATQANNCIIDRYGRLGSRRGNQLFTTNSGTLPSTAYLKSMFEFKDVDGNIIYLSSGDNKLFTGLDILVEKPVRDVHDTIDIAYTITDTNWQIVSNPLSAGSAGGAVAYLAQNGHPMLTYSKAITNNLVYRQLADVGSIPTGLSTAEFDPNCITAAYGRVWAASTTSNKTIVYYSRLLDGTHFTGTGTGLLDISAQVGNNDKITAIAGYNGFLIIFCEDNILVYDNADDPTQIVLADTIQGVGCVARDTVQKCGEDLVFLSRSGVRSLRRTIQEKSMPMRELSANIRDQLIEQVNSELYKDIKSVYFERDAFYLLTLPSQMQIVCFDMRANLENGSSRVTYWTSLDFKSLLATNDNRLYFGGMGGFYHYFGYTDNGNSYRMTWFSSSSDLGSQSVLKILKKTKLTIISDEAQDYIFKYNFNYSDDFASRTIEKDASQIISEYNVAEYGIGEYSGGIYITQVSINIGGQGDIVKIGVETEVDGAPVSLQRIDLYYKTGRLA